MTKKIIIDGMSCGHCVAAVEKALNAIENVKAKVDLETRTAALELSGDVSDTVLRAAVEDIGFDVLSIE